MLAILVSVTLFVVSAVAAIFVLQISWLLALMGIGMTIAGLISNLRRDAKLRSSGMNRDERQGINVLLWSGLALVAAPIFNITLLMPFLRQII